MSFLADDGLVNCLSKPESIEMYTGCYVGNKESFLYKWLCQVKVS